MNYKNKLKKRLRIADYISNGAFILLIVGISVLCLSTEYNYSMSWALIPLIPAGLLLMYVESIYQKIRKDLVDYENSI